MPCYFFFSVISVQLHRCRFGWRTGWTGIASALFPFRLISQPWHVAGGKQPVLPLRLLCVLLLHRPTAKEYSLFIRLARSRFDISRSANRSLRPSVLWVFSSLAASLDVLFIHQFVRLFIKFESLAHSIAKQRVFFFHSEFFRF